MTEEERAEASLLGWSRAVSLAGPRLLPAGAWTDQEADGGCGQRGMQSWRWACSLTLTETRTVLGGCAWLGGEPVAEGPMAGFWIQSG